MNNYKSPDVPSSNWNPKVTRYRHNIVCIPLERRNHRTTIPLNSKGLTTQPPLGCSQGPSRTTSYTRGTWALPTLADDASAMPAGPFLRLPPLRPGRCVGDDYDIILLIDQREQVRTGV